jgi:hypothetical protein
MAGLMQAWMSRLSFEKDAAWWNVKWAARGFGRRFGWPGWLILASLLVASLAWVVEQRQTTFLSGAKDRQTQQRPAPAVYASPVQTNGATHIQAFDDFLLPHDEIPSAIQELLRVAGEQKLIALKGEYRATIESQGEFMRYRMLIPVKGDAQAIRRFMQAAMLSQKALALESIQFKRDRIDSTEIEAKINWVLFTQLPSQSGVPLSSDESNSSSAPAASPSVKQ